MRYIAFFIVFLATHPLAQATHLRAADILVETLCGQERTYRITVVAYLNTQSNTRFGTNSEVHFGDGSFVRIPVTNATLRPDLGSNIAIATYTTLHTYPAIGNYTVTYIERDRSSNILNIVNSDDVPYVTFVNFTINPTDNCNNTPVLTIPPLDRACYKSAFFHTPGAYDPDGDSLSYELSVPASGLSTFASYTAPNNFRFYSNVSQGNEAGNGNPIFSIDPVSGLLTWDAPGTIGEYNIAFKIIEWRKDSTTNIYRKLSTTTRDMQIVVEECTNIRPALDVPADICVVAGTSISEIITGIDIDNHNLKIEVFAEIVDFSADRFPATFTPNPPAFNPAPAQLQFQWQTHCLHVRQQPYQVVFKITDNPPNGPKLVNFRIWNIKVVGPPPIWQNPTLDLVNRQSVLNWSSYACNNASKIQVWRRTDSFSFNPNCAPGLPRYTGYNLIAELPISQTTFTDTNVGRGLSAGARYCYRLLTYYNSPASTPSLVSSEFCFDPIETDEPVITHVTVEQTAEADGKIRISWRTPTGINQSQFPKPYQYEVFRASGLFEEDDITLAGRIDDTTFLDTGINTLENSFNYRVVLFAQPAQTQVWARVDTSAMASVVRLTFDIAEKEITLAWRDSVPWTNIVQSKPYHLIYRGVEETNPARMILIDSVNVTEAGFTYVDKGTFNNQALEEDKRYSYRVLTRGTYGNHSITGKFLAGGYYLS